MFFDRIEMAQRVLRTLAGYAGGIDGDPGPASLAAAARVVGVRVGHADGWPPERNVIAGAQLALAAQGFEPGPADGLWGVQTDGAFRHWRAKGLGIAFVDRRGDLELARPDQLKRIYGKPGHARCTAGKVVPPWRMVLAWDTRQEITEFSCHELVADVFQAALDQVAKEYTPREIQDLGLHLYGGCYNLRKMRGGDEWSTHAYGIALDFDPARNRLTWPAYRARLARPDAAKFWDALETHGIVSLGRAKNYDWMHAQKGVAPDA